MAATQMKNPSAVFAVCALALACGCRRTETPRLSRIEVGKAGNEERLRGFYETTGSWRWTSRVFAVLLDPPSQGREVYLELDMDLPREIMSVSGAVTLTARVNGVEAGRQKYLSMGRRLFSMRVPEAALAKQPALVEFELDQQAEGPGKRPLGLIAFSAALQDLEDTAEYRDLHSRMAREGYDRLKSPGQDRALMKLFHQLPVWESLWFHNVRLVKNPVDLWTIQQMVYELQPEFIVETGTWRGGSALYWASLLDGMGLENSRVLTVDIQTCAQSASTHPLWKKYVEFYQGSSTDPAIVSEIARRVRGRKTLVTLDSDHAMRHVLRELRMYSPMVSRGSYLIVEDGHMDGVPTYPDSGPGPVAATLEFLKQGGAKEFEQDLTRESMGMTFNPGGWLRRTR
jgi:cephalosporin hydroxylase